MVWKQQEAGISEEREYRRQRKRIIKAAGHAAVLYACAWFLPPRRYAGDGRSERRERLLLLTSEHGNSLRLRKWSRRGKEIQFAPGKGKIQRTRGRTRPNAPDNLAKTEPVPRQALTCPQNVRGPVPKIAKTGPVPRQAMTCPHIVRQKSRVSWPSPSRLNDMRCRGVVPSCLMAARCFAVGYPLLLSQS